MAPKRVKSGTVSTPAATAVGNKAWDAGLTSAQFDEDSWRASISLVVGERLEDEELISALQLAMLQPTRRLFSLVSRETTLEKIHELGNPKTKKTKDSPMFWEVLEAAKALLDAGEELPADLLGKVLKFQLLGVKTSDQQRRAAEQKATDDKAKTKAGVAPPTKDKDKDKGPAKPPAKGGEGKMAPEPSAPSKETHLKRRGEEDETNKYTDDEPDDGPQHYILVVGFHQAQLPAVLGAMGVHVANVIRLSSGKTHSPDPGSGSPLLDEEVGLRRRQRDLELFWAQLEAVLDSGPALSKLWDVARLSYTANQTLPSLDRESAEARLALGQCVFEGLACVIYDSLDWRRQHQHYLSSMRLLQVPSILEPRYPRQESPVEAAPTPTPQTPGSKKKSVPESEPSPLLTTEVDMRLYSDLLEQIPPEACSVPLILHCMLEQVVVSEETSPPLSGSDTEQRAEGLDPRLASHMLVTVLALGRPSDDHTRLQEELGVQPSIQQSADSQRPLLFNSHDYRALRLQLLPVCKQFEAMQIEADVMRRSLVTSLLNLPASSSSSSASQQARTHQFIHHCTDGSLRWAEVERGLRRGVLEGMPLTQLDQEGVLARTRAPEPVLIPWDEPEAFAKHLHRLRTGTRGERCDPEQLSVADIQKSRLRSLRDWNYTEHHPAHVLPQVLQVASETYRCMDTFRSRDDTVYVICHNPMSPQRQCKELWDVALHTDVGFRKYLEHVAASISDWTKEEEVKWLAAEVEREHFTTGSADLRSHSISPTKSPVLTEAVSSEQYVREGSLKAWKLEQERLKEEDQVSRSKKEEKGKGPAKGAERADSSKDKKKTPPVAKKSREDVSKTPDAPAAPPPADQAGELQAAEDAFAGFTGYSMEGNLIQVSGQVQSLFPSDGGSIQVESIQYIQGSSLLKVCVMKDQHRFYTHICQPYRGQEEPGAREPGDSSPRSGPTNRSAKTGLFSAVLASGVHMSYSHYGDTGERTGDLSVGPSLEGHPPPLASSPLLPSSHTEEGGVGPEEASQPADRESPPLPAACPPFQGLTLSTPSGLLLQVLRESTEGVAPSEQGVLLRQSFPLCGGGGGVALQPDPSLTSELSRVITPQGAVVKYMRDGSTQVLFADGSVSSSSDSGPVFPLAPEMLSRGEEPAKDPVPKNAKDKKGKLSSKQTVGSEQGELEPTVDTRSSAHSHGGCWVTTTPSGLRVATRGHTVITAPPALAYRATDPITQTMVVTREDQVLTVVEPDGSVTVEHADGTRITTLYQQRRDRVLMVEKEGFASVVVFPEERSCNIFLADGTVITATHTGAYQVYPSNEGLLVIKEDGSCEYTSDSAPGPTLTSDPARDPALTSQRRSPRDQPGSYLMNHTADILCEVVDPEGNLFQVMVDGQCPVVISSPVETSVEEEEEEEESQEEERESTDRVMGRKRHLPRLFMVHEDGSGTELLHVQAVEEVLDQAYSDPTIALLEEPLPDLEEVVAITMLKPCQQSVWSSWLMPKQNQDILPPNLKSRSWDNFPSTERKTPGPVFGTSLGRGLSLGGTLCSRAHPPLLSCPDALEVRQLLRYRPVSLRLRRALEARLRDFMQQVIQKEQQSEEMLLKDPRSEEEKMRSSHLLKLLLSLPDPEEPSMNKRAGDIAALYCQAMSCDQQRDAAAVASKTSHTDTDSECKPSSLWPSRIQQYRQELAEDRLQREALRNRIIPPYFHPDSSLEAPEMTALSRDLPPFPQTGQSDSFLRDAPQEKAQRPLNPTPSHAAGSDSTSVGRPTNPTPQTAGDRGGAGWSERRAERRRTSGLQVDVAGQPRTRPVRLPASILSSKPHSRPNHQFLSVEEPVRRKVRTVSVIGQPAARRGFELLPSEVSFGSLREGSTYAVTVVMRNVGVDTCRFTVKQPPPSTGLTVTYSPGPVAAGMKVDLLVQLFAMAAGQEGGGQEEEDRREGEVQLSQSLLIHTETETLDLAVSANILTHCLL
ncbi:LOW QUALITY PROTEIN: sperm-associated antigen 17 [Hypomesus transpacificus]|uniref:LOW QUALITY PROTEIN: sperm-associated antigen 17 n=1 Tax=Hypomesus transpacificus TaxID=137520 RepID=UPI001F07FFBB|nr:LOW QUALITY PROTEIN: sperm-associated antigen 17 [Hypomesus transpacificus]